MQQPGVYLFFLVVTVIYACNELSEVKVSAQRGMSMQRQLWQKLIGRNMTPEEMQEYRCDGKSSSECYKETLDKILNSDAWYNEGFFHLHRQRLLLHQLRVGDIESYASDYRSLQLEMAEVAHADNYWQLLTYRERWVDIISLSPHQSYLYHCREYLNGFAAELQRCTEGLLRIFAKIAHKASVLYRALCTGSTPDRRLPPLDQSYRRLFGSDFCDFTAKSNWSDSIDIGSELADILSFLAAATAAAKLDFFPELAVVVDTDNKPLIKTHSKTNMYIKIRFPAALQGIHANPFWLTKHSTSPLNQHLHRAKIIWHSWFCQRIAPDNARAKMQKNEGDMTAAELTAWHKLQAEQKAASVYFAKDDSHAKGDQLCFNCHRRIQPVANYFGGLNMRQLGYAHNYNIGDVFAQEAAHNRPGGYWNDSSADFIPGVGGQGMEGLAQLLSTLPRVRTCIVKSSWNHFFGSGYALNSTEVAAAAASFAASGFDYRQLLQHLLHREEAITYFTAGEQQFHDTMAKKRLTCELAYEKAKQDPQASVAATAAEIISASCHPCHADNLIDDPTTILGRITEGGGMPQNDNYALLSGYTQEESNDIQRKALECYFTAQLGATTVPSPPQKDAELARMGHLVDGKEAGR